MLTEKEPEDFSLGPVVAASSKPLPSVTEKPFDSDSELYGEIIEFIRAHVDLADERHFHVLACYGFMCKRFKQFMAIPYVLLLGPPEVGKTRVLDVFKALFSEKAVETANISEAPLFRMVNWKEPDIMLLDEFDRTSDDRMEAITQLLNAGYKVGGTAIRCKPKTHEPEEFNVYCPKILASNTEPHATVLSRSIILQMRRAMRPIKFHVDTIRAQTLGAKLHEYGEQHFAESPNKPYQPAEWGSNRLAELFEPLFQVAPTAESENALRLLCRDLAEERKIFDASGLDAVYVKAIKVHVDHAGTLDSDGIVNFTIPDILVTVKSLIENEWLSRQQTGHKIAKRLRVLGWHPKHVESGSRWEMAPNEYKALLTRFQL